MGERGSPGTSLGRIRVKHGRPSSQDLHVSKRWQPTGIDFKPMFFFFCQSYFKRTTNPTYPGGSFQSGHVVQCQSARSLLLDGTDLPCGVPGGLDQGTLGTNSGLRKAVAASACVFKLIWGRGHAHHRAFARASLGLL